MINVLREENQSFVFVCLCELCVHNFFSSDSAELSSNLREKHAVSSK